MRGKHLGSDEMSKQKQEEIAERVGLLPSTKEPPQIPKKKLPCAKKTETIHESLRKIKEQIEIFPEFYERLHQIETKQDMIIELLTEISVLLKSRVGMLNGLDQKEMEVMDALLAKMAK